MERFDFGLQKENTRSQLHGSSKHCLTFLRQVLLDRLNPATLASTKKADILATWMEDTSPAHPYGCQYRK